MSNYVKKTPEFCPKCGENHLSKSTDDECKRCYEKDLLGEERFIESSIFHVVGGGIPMFE